MVMVWVIWYSGGLGNRLWFWSMVMVMVMVTRYGYGL